MDIHVIEGGIGRELFFTALLPELAKKEQVIVMSSYPDIFENNPYVYRSFSRNTPYVWEDFILKKENTVKFYDPYFNGDFIQRKIHVLNAYAKGLNIEYNETMLPELYLHDNLIKDAKTFKKDTGKFIIVQFNSGQSPLTNDFKKPFKWEGFKREYPLELAQELINKITKKYPDIKILNYALPNEESFKLENTVKIQAPYLFYAALLNEAETFIGINSSLTHFAAAMKKKGIVLWGGTSPNQWGYKTHINISGECPDLYCSRPYLRELGDYIGSGTQWKCSHGNCMKIDSNLILKEFSKLV